MRTVGLIGGMSWESTLLYYRIINQQVGAALGKLHSAPLLIYSFDFEVIAELQRSGQWNRAAGMMAEAGGAEAIILGCTEICLLLEGDEYNGLPLFNTTLIHAQQAASFALMDSPVLEPA